jgi:hypothetical protein
MGSPGKGKPDEEREDELRAAIVPAKSSRVVHGIVPEEERSVGRSISPTS